MKTDLTTETLTVIYNPLHTYMHAMQQPLGKKKNEFSLGWPGRLGGGRGAILLGQNPRDLPLWDRIQLAMLHPQAADQVPCGDVVAAVASPWLGNPGARRAMATPSVPSARPPYGGARWDV